jgi:hypothetical protein
MKNSGILLASLTLLCLAFVQCKKTKEIKNTQLLITLKDTAGDKVSGATIRLYKDSTDPGIIKISDSTGIALFSDLDVALYYWSAQKACMSNRNDQVTTNRPLVFGTVMYGYSIMADTGTLKIINTSSEPYKIVDSPFINIILNDTPYLSHPNTGSYKLHVEKQSSPGTGKDTLIEITCGNISVLNIPF